MSEGRIEVEDNDGVRLIAFNRPEVRNAFDAAMYAAVTEALSGALEDDGIRAVVITGRGKAFTSGQDLREMVELAAGKGGPEAGSGFQGLLDVVISFDKPLLAAVHGVAMGLGCTLLPHIDLVLIEEGARLRAPFAELGVPPEAASSWLLPERMGWQRARPCCSGRSGSMRQKQLTPVWPSGSVRPGRCSRRRWHWLAGSLRSHRMPPVRSSS